MSTVSRSVRPATANAEFAADVASYLSRKPRQVPSRYLYDALGSSLFEAICRLPWYGLTRAENRLLTSHAAAIWRRAPRVEALSELGPGSGEKLALLLSASPARSTPIDLHLIDISASALAQAVTTLGTFHANPVAYQSDYETGLRRFADARSGARRAMIVFLGSNLGNFDQPGRQALLRAIRAASQPGDALLIGVDLVKDEADLLRAYDDPLGVTAAFNRNVLVRINRELGGNFVLGEFTHRAVWNAEHRRVEMHLWSRRSQRVRIVNAELEFTIETGESIWTESSYKFTPESLASLLAQSGFAVTEQWIDHEDPFALTLAVAT